MGTPGNNSGNTMLVCDATNYIAMYCRASPGSLSGDCSRALLRAANAALAMHPSYRVVVFAFDTPGPSWREEVYPDWKGNRLERSSDIPGVSREVAAARRLLPENGYLAYASPGFDGDDVVATICERATSGGLRCVIWSGDSDFRQLLSDGQVSQLTKFRSNGGGREEEFLTAGGFREKHGFDPGSWPDYRTLCGKPGDGWGGADGIGDKKASELVGTFKTVELVMEKFRNGQLEGLNKRQVAGLESLDWTTGKTVMSLRTDAPLVPVGKCRSN